MEIKKAGTADMKRFVGYVRNAWPELASALKVLDKGESIIITSTEWKSKYAHTKNPRQNAKTNIKAVAKRYGKAVTILNDPDNDDLAVIRTE
jgi:hypothetical protein